MRKTKIIYKKFKTKFDAKNLLFWKEEPSICKKYIKIQKEKKNIKKKRGIYLKLKSKRIREYITNETREKKKKKELSEIELIKTQIREKKMKEKNKC